jgi:hypothetical protein
MNKLLSTLCLLLLSFSAYSAPITIEPPLPLQPEEGPFGYGGRGVVFRAEQDFSMTSFGMDLNFPGTLDFAVSVYAINGTSRGGLISETLYPALTDDGSAFFTLQHAQDFSAGSSYEIIMRFSDPGVIFPHYDFSNDSLDPANGFVAGDMLVLDGSDFDTAGLANVWLARFQLNGDGSVPVPSPTQEPVPSLGFSGLMALILTIMLIAVWGRRSYFSRG